MMNNQPCTGKRELHQIDGENFYFIVTREPDGTIAMMATTPMENRPENQKNRRMADEFCSVLEGLTNRVLGEG